MTDQSPRLKAAFKYMVYGRSTSLDIDRIIDMLQALEKFVAVKDSGDGSAFKVDGIRGGVYVGKGGDAIGTKKLVVDNIGLAPLPTTSTSIEVRKTVSDTSVRESLKFFFSDEGLLFREFVVDEITNGIDAISRDAVRELFLRLGIRGSRVPVIFKSMAPKLTSSDRKVVESLIKLLNFFSGRDLNDANGSSSQFINSLLTTVTNPGNRNKLIAMIPTFREFAPNMRQFGLEVTRKLTIKGTVRLIDAIFRTSN